MKKENAIKALKKIADEEGYAFNNETCIVKELKSVTGKPLTISIEYSEITHDIIFYQNSEFWFSSKTIKHALEMS